MEKKKDDTKIYCEKWRPRFHYTAARSWLNDPNGMVYFNGVYHLCYQTTPESAVNNGDIHWGHATSTDLIHWTEHDPVLSPDKVGTMWSGTSAVVRDDPSGTIGGEGIVAAYSTDTQNVGVALSRDGYHFTKISESAPVISHPDGVADFRDPHIFFYPEDSKWKMVIAGGLLRIYESSDLVHWSPCGEAQEEYNTECPNLIRMKTENTGEEKWVLSLGGRDYVVGSFDGKRFYGETEKIIMDDGADTYAGITFSDVPDGRVIMMSWLNRWWYAKNTPEGCWNGALTLPVEMRLIKTADSYRLLQTPVAEAEKLRRGLIFSCGAEEIGVNENPLDSVCADVYEMIFTVDISRSSAFEIGLRVGEGDSTKIRFSPDTMALVFDRSECADGSRELVEKFNPRECTISKDAARDGKLTFRIFVDRSSVEMFIGGGYHYFVMRIQPRETSRGMYISACDRVTIDGIEIYELENIWGNRA